MAGTMKKCLWCLLLGFAALLATGCNSDDNTGAGVGLESVAFTVGYVSLDSFDVTERALSLDDRLVFRIIPGYMFGSAVPSNIIDIPVEGRSEVGVSFSDSVFNDEARPGILTVDAANNGYTIEPADTMFGRIGTFYVDLEGTFLPTSYGLFDYNSEIEFIIAYFDRAAIFKGSAARSDGNSEEFDVVVPRAGFYALGGKWVENTDGTYRYLYQVVDIKGEALFYILDASE